MENPKCGIVSKDYETRMYFPCIKMAYKITVRMTLGENVLFQANASK